MVQAHRVVIIGGGFGGLQAAKAFKGSSVAVTLIDRRNFHLFQPLLYQVATGGLSPANIAAPLRALMKNYANVMVWLGEVLDIDTTARKVILSDDAVTYDSLIVSAGARHSYFGHDDWEALAPGLKTLEDATEIRRRILTAFEAAERERDPARRQALLTFVVVGGGPTGVELAGAIGELAHHTLRHNFRRIDPASARILLLEGQDRILPPYPPALSAKARIALTQLGVSVRTGATVSRIQPEAVTVREGDRSELIACHTVLWAAGVTASPLGKALERAGATLDRAGRVVVGADLTAPGHPEIFVIGDLASFSDPSGKPLPGVAPVAMQQGHYAAKTILARLQGKDYPPFHYRDYGTVATIGRNRAVADLGWLHLSGYVAWLAWLFIHLLKLVGFQNRILVLSQWAYNYLTRNRSARLITRVADEYPGA